ncbi:MAG TPA: adenylate/guanylate cyclase domain-containing protein [Anaerolineae bacterium]|nr:adenylate/guanylate cyclase domain-containing protein [Anaerolineae bacterium]
MNICTNCQTENPSVAKFCMNCGTPFNPTCTNCQNPLPPQATFCPHCGIPTTTRNLPPILATGERRIVTIMFADISGFTALSEKLDPEQVRTLMNTCFDHLVPIIEQYDGVIDKFIGDEIMALFGAPTAHEDDPFRAVRAAWEMMAALEKFNQQQDTNLGIHIGINTGLVVAGGIGSQGRQNYSVLGDAVNLAARLEEISQRGEIWVGPDTFRHSQHAFRFDKLDPIRVKGKQHPVQVYRVLGPKHQPERVRGLAGLTSPMVGRQQEITTIHTATNALLNHQQTSLIWISGEAGLGKSRLLSEWQTNTAPPAHWVTAQCLSYGHRLAYHLLIDLVRQLAHIPAAATDDEAYQHLHQLINQTFPDNHTDALTYLAHLLNLHTTHTAKLTIDPQSLQARYLTILRQLLQTISQEKPLILIIEDIHWADPASTELLSKLLTLSETAPILFCVATRPEPDTPGWRLLTAARDVLDANHIHEINLTTLSNQDSQQLIANLLEIESLPTVIRQLILERAEGNPFFVEEVIRMLIDQGYIFQENGRWHAHPNINTVDIPDNLQGLLLARIDRLPEETKQTLRIAAVIGRQFSLKVLQEVLNHTNSTP